MPASPHMGVNGNHDKCPICKGPPKHCPHSFGDMIERTWEDWCRAIVRDEIKREKRRQQEF